MYDREVGRIAHDLVAKIGDNSDNLSLLTDAELSVMRLNAKQSTALLAAKMVEACSDEAHINAAIDDALAFGCKDEESFAKLRKRAKRCFDRLANRQRATIPQLAALYVHGFVEAHTLDREAARREAGRAP